MKKLLLLCLTCLPGLLRADTVLVFNEIMYHPATNEAAMEWVEFRNQMAVDVDVSGWSIAGGIQYTFPSNSIVRGGGLVVVAISPGDLMAATGLTNVLGPFAGRLSNNGNRLQLINNSGRVVDEVNYGTDGDWPVAPDGSGASLAKLDGDSASGPPENWMTSDQIGGTPGAENFPFYNNSPPDIRLLSTDAIWKYEASGTDLGTAWRQPVYADAGWSSGKCWLYTGSITNGETRSLPTLFNTGTSTNGNVLPPGALDPHYTITVAAQGPINTNAIVMANNTAWLADDTTSSWIGVNSDGNATVNQGGYRYRTTFDLSGFAPSTVSVSFSMAADDQCTNVFLNGAPLGFSFTGFTAYSPVFNLPNAQLATTNTLEFRAVNGGTSPNPHGFRANFTSSGRFIMTNTFLPAGPATYYLRNAFVFGGDPANTALHINAIVDDGAVFYLNGVEVYRVNMPAGDVTYATPASSTVTSPAYTGFLIPAASLIHGTNVLAVEVHQAAGDTSDLLFGAELLATPLAPPQFRIGFNELSSSTNNEFWLELLNYGTNTLLLDGCSIYRDGGTNLNNQYVFPAASLTLAPGAFLSVTNTTLGFHPVSGDKLYLYSAMGRIFDSVVVKKAHRGRFPDGSGPWLFPNLDTPGASNSFAFHNEIVINEIMYKHAPLPPPATNLPPQNSSEAWLELFNKGANAIDLTGWELTSGISYKFPNGKTIAAGGYLVVAKDSTALRAVYPAIDIVGDYGGHLASDTLVVLNDPSGNPADQVRFSTSGRWSAFANGAGSSLELRDPNADNIQPQAWAASDESGKSSWQTYSYRTLATIPSGSGQPTMWNDFIFGLLSDGECLIDDISVVESPTNNPVQFIANGDFENGLTGWRLLGNQGRSRLEIDPDNPANHVLHIISTGPQEHMHNHIETTYVGGRSVTAGRQYQISFRAKWLAGNNLLNTRLYFNRVGRTTALPMPSLNGTPGARNSRYEANIGPTFSQLQHRSVIPQPGEAVTVSVLAQDPQGVASCQVWWSTNGGAWANAPMTNQGGALYAGMIPGFPSRTVVQFYVSGIDGLGAAATFPAAGPDSGALYAVADDQANLPLAHNVRILLTPANTALLHAFTNVMSNDNLPCTVIYDEKRPYYDMSIRLKGSERGRYSDTRVSFHLEFQPDDPFRGVHPVMLIDRSGAGDAPNNKQEEILIKHMLMRAGGIPGTYSDLCRVIAPMSIHTGPGIFCPRQEDEFISTAFANGGSGTMWELELVYYPTTTNQFGYKNPQPDSVIGTDISDLGADKETYRYNFIIKNHRDVDDYSSFISFARTLSLSGSPLDFQSRQVMDVDEWARAFALVTLCGVGDSYTFGNNHNLLMYQRPSDGKMLAFPWDMDFSFNRANNAALIGDQNLSKVFNLTSNQRLFYGHIMDIIGSAYNTAYMAYWVPRYASFCPGQDYSGVIPYIQARSDYARTTINNAGGNAPFAVNGTSPITSSSNLITLTGTAPVQVRTIRVNGLDLPITWTSVSAWTIRLAVSSPTNIFTIEAVDLAGHVLSNLTHTVTVNFTGTVEPAPGRVVINEIMYNPVVAGASYVELGNISPSFAFDLSGWRLHGLNYTFPTGSFIPPGGFLVLAQDSVAFGAAYGASTPVFGVFDGNLQTNGETLSLVQPGPTPAQDVVINKVRYESAAPWPAGANGQGSALQLIDPVQDNARASNWGDGTGWRFASYTINLGSATNASGSSIATNLAIFLQTAGEAYLDDISFVPLSGQLAGANVLQNGDFEGPLSGPWTIPPTMGGSVITNTFAHSGSYCLHVVATNAPASLNNTVKQLFPPLETNILCTLSFWYHSGASTNLVLRTLGGSGANTINVTINLKPTITTPGSTNSIRASLPPYPLLWINELQPDNLDGITDNAGQHDPWIELYNSGTNSLSLDGCFLANNYTNLAQWSFPSGVVINAGEFKVMFVDGDA